MLADGARRTVRAGAFVLLVVGVLCVVVGLAAPGRQPGRDQLACSVLTSGGVVDPRASVSDTAALSEDRRVIDGRGLWPLLVLTRYDEGSLLTCEGPAARWTQPLYVVAVDPLLDVVPMAAFSLAALTLVVGGGGLVLLRPRR